MIRILFGIQNEEKDAIWDEVEMYNLSETINKILNINLECNDSITYGDYFADSPDKEIIYLHINELINDEELLEQDFPEYAYLLYINEVEEYPEYVAAIEARSDIFVKLRTTEV
ncbi:hypothetical protein PMI41_03485 [Phyllobacterium sp. YR531]|nr:hypothetical protein PMI41_03485 [Phyllobacterium sp. YR531]